MQTEIEKARHAHERGEIIRTLKADYSSEMTALSGLRRALDLQGISLSQQDLEFHLTYLEEQGYARVWRARDLPGHRLDRQVPGWMKAGTIMFAKLLPRGLQLLDGLVGEDPSVAF
jgi:hypothetical protein